MVSYSTPLPLSDAGPPYALATGARSASVTSPRAAADWRYLRAFVLLTFVLQIALVPAALFPIRTPLRIALYSAGLAMLLLVRRRGRLSPVTNYAKAVITIMTLGLLNPLVMPSLAGLASIVLCLAIISPVFWVSRLRVSPAHLQKILLLFWSFHAASTAVGIGEVLLPGYFSRESSITTLMQGEYAEGLKITLGDGTQIYRPMGLTDTPGGACRSGFLVVLIGTGLLIQRPSDTMKMLYLAGIAGGLFCIYMTQVRSVLVLTVLCECVILAVLAKRGDSARLLGISLVLLLLAAGATTWAFTKGGDAVSDRVLSLTEASPTEVYYKNRGRFLDHTFRELLPKYPLGAGLGRWGMCYAYFGDKGPHGPESIWVEIQPTGWLLDGGVPLMVVYYAAMLTCCVVAYRLARGGRGLLSDAALIVLAYDIGMLANTFSYAPFVGQSGLDFWLLNAAMFAAMPFQTAHRAGAALPAMPFGAPEAPR